MHIEELPTPCAVVDLDRLERNCERMSERMRALGVRLRPHVKTHKCAEAARLQVRGHFGGITVSTLAEARAFAAAGFADITYAVPIAPARGPTGQTSPGRAITDPPAAKDDPAGGLGQKFGQPPGAPDYGVGRRLPGQDGRGAGNQVQFLPGVDLDKQRAEPGQLGLVDVHRRRLPVLDTPFGEAAPGKDGVAHHVPGGGVDGIGAPEQHRIGLIPDDLQGGPGQAVLLNALVVGGLEGQIRRFQPGS